jgi:NADPH-dependent 2,4-dienoyl-CoA reductase/sulfur reductase-like enzyme
MDNAVALMALTGKISGKVGVHRYRYAAGWSGIRCMAAMQPPSPMHVTVVGGGAAGLAAAYFAAREGAKV